MKNKILFILIGFIAFTFLFSAISNTAYSYDENLFFKKDPDFYNQKPSSNIPIDGIVQIQVHNSDNQLVAYIESYEIILLDYPETLDLPTNEFVIVDGKRFALLEFETEAEVKGKIFSSTQTTSYLNGMSFLSQHRGFPPENGDKYLVTWKLAIPI